MGIQCIDISNYKYFFVLVNNSFVRFYDNQYIL
jgi:hypothetical protein